MRVIIGLINHFLFSLIRFSFFNYVYDLSQPLRRIWLRRGARKEEFLEFSLSWVSVWDWEDSNRSKRKNKYMLLQKKKKKWSIRLGYRDYSSRGGEAKRDHNGYFFSSSLIIRRRGIQKSWSVANFIFAICNLTNRRESSTKIILSLIRRLVVFFFLFLFIVLKVELDRKNIFTEICK